MSSIMYELWTINIILNDHMILKATYLDKKVLLLYILNHGLLQYSV